MIPKMVDMLVHVNENLDQANQEALVNKVRDMHGVFSAHIPAGKPHLMLVEYNPDWIRSRNIMEVVSDRGLHAQMVGF
jgi:hypothetical protein